MCIATSRVITNTLVLSFGITNAKGIEWDHIKYSIKSREGTKKGEGTKSKSIANRDLVDINKTILTITLNVNSLNMPIK